MPQVLIGGKCDGERAAGDRGAKNMYSHSGLKDCVLCDCLPTKLDAVGNMRRRC